MDLMSACFGAMVGGGFCAFLAFLGAGDLKGGFLGPFCKKVKVGFCLLGGEVVGNDVWARLVPCDNSGVGANVSIVLDISTSLCVRCAGEFAGAGSCPPCSRCPAGPCGHLHTTGMMSSALLSMSYLRHRISCSLRGASADINTFLSLLSPWYTPGERRRVLKEPGERRRVLKEPT